MPNTDITTHTGTGTKNAVPATYALKDAEILPVASPLAMETVLAARAAFADAMKKTFNRDDTYLVGGKRMLTKQGIQKLRAICGITLTIVDTETKEYKDAFEFVYHVRASTRNGMVSVENVGSCSTDEKPPISRSFAREKALTRAENRAIADLLGISDITAV